MPTEISLGNHTIGSDRPVCVVAEIGINHNGDVDLARKLIDVAAAAGCSAVKFQKRTPELCVPRTERDKIRETPWAPMTYLDYRKRIEFGEAEYREIDAYCKEKDIMWFASPWDMESVDFLEMFSPPLPQGGLSLFDR